MRVEQCDIMCFDLMQQELLNISHEVFLLKIFNLNIIMGKSLHIQNVKHSTAGFHVRKNKKDGKTPRFKKNKKKEKKVLFGSRIGENRKLNREYIVYKISTSYSHLLYLRFNLSLVTSTSNHHALSTYSMSFSSYIW